MVEQLFLQAWCDKNLVFFCASQSPYFADSKFKSHGLLGEGRRTMH